MVDICYVPNYASVFSSRSPTSTTVCISFQPQFLFPRDALHVLLPVWLWFANNPSKSMCLWRIIKELLIALMCHQKIVIIVEPTTKQIAARSRNILGVFLLLQSLQCPEVICWRCCAIPKKTKQRTIKTNPTKMNMLLRIILRLIDLGSSWRSMAKSHVKTAKM